jgi:hypothetical protein
MNRHVTFALIAAFLALGGCGAEPQTLAQQQAADAVPPIPPDRARIFVFRNYRPDRPPVTPTVYIDGQAAGQSKLGSVFERDVAPGSHIISTDLRHPEFAEVTQVTLAPGSTAYLAIDDNWIENDTQGRQTPIFSIAAIDPRIAAPQASRLPLISGRVDSLPQ